MQDSARTWMVATRTSTPYRRATMADVAKAAGVDKGTVSRAIRGISGVRSDTRERILEAAAALEFTGSHLPGAMSAGDIRTVGIVLPTLDSWYFVEVAAGASETLSPAGFRVELINLDAGADDDALINSPRFVQLLRELGSGRGREALLYAATISVESDDERDGHGRVPVSASHLPIQSVRSGFVDNRRGGRLAGEHLLALGHRTIAVVDGRESRATETRVWERRTAGIVDAWSAAGRTPGDIRVITPGGGTPADGERALQLMLGEGPRPTAVFCHTDELAFGVISSANALGLTVPDRLSVIGFDGHPMAHHLGLTTVNQHARSQGRQAAEALLEAINDATPGDPEPIEVELVVRRSTARPA